MSSKIDVGQILTGHFSTLRDAHSGVLHRKDIFIFYILPVLFGALGFAFGLDLDKDTVNVLVTVGSILTGLLLNLLILVYDQKSKLPKVDVTKTDISWEVVQARHNALKELYYNISYATLISLAVAVLSILHLSMIGFKPVFQGQFKGLVFNFGLSLTQCISTPVLIFLSVNLILTILMVIKRIYTLLTTE